MALMPIIIRSKPGIKRDGTKLDSEHYVDGQWVRFQRQLPRKIAGYTTINRFGTQIVRTIKTFALDEYTYIFVGGATVLEYLTMDLEGNTTIILTRTPTNLLQNPLNTWQFDIMVDGSNIPPVNLLLAQAAANGRSLSSTAEGQVFYGPVADPSLAGTPLVDFTWALQALFLSTSGGLLALYPYLVVFGNAGSIAWSAPDRPTRFNLYEFASTTVSTTDVSPIGGNYVVATAGTIIAPGDLIAFSASDTAPYYGVTSVGTLTLLQVSFTPQASVSYAAGSTVYQFIGYPAITLAANLAPGDNVFYLQNDRTAFLNAIPGGRLSFNGGANETTYFASIYLPDLDLTAVSIVTPFASTQLASAVLSRLEPNGFIAGRNIAVGDNAFFAVGASSAQFPVTTRIGFATYDTAIYVVTGSGGGNVTVNILSLANPLQQTIPSGSTVYLQGATAQVATGAGNARVASQKIVKGVALRGGGGNSPSALLWSIDALLRMTFVGGEQIFQFDTISPTSSILAANSVIEYDGTYYWIGSDRFLVFNGVVRELPNDLNINWFFDNLNRVWANRIFAFKVPKYSEIWWCFPYGNSTECNYAIIYNIRENTWYDTKLPNSGRSAGEFMATFGKPLLAGVDSLPSIENPNQMAYRLWQHETGVDEVDITQVYPVESYFETAPFSLITQPQGKLKSMRVAVIEPDFVQSGDMEVEIIGQSNARAGIVVSDTRVFPQEIRTAFDQVVRMKDERRILRFRFRSNVFGGDYQLGRVVAHIEETDGTFLGAVGDTNY